MNLESALERHFPFVRKGNLLNPPPEYSALRLDGPIQRVTLWNGQTAWLVTRWEDVREVLSSPHVSSDPDRRGYPSFSPGRTAHIKSRKTFINMDPPDHTLYRRMLTKEFTLKRMQELRPFVQDIVDQLLDDMLRKGPPADIVTALARPLPARVISVMLGVPYAHYADLQRWTETRNDLTSDPAEVLAAAERMTDVLGGILRGKEAQPGNGDDLLSRMAIEHINTGHLQHDEAVRMAIFLYMAGHSTTASQTALGILSFLQFPDQHAALLANPSLLKGAIEEMLRFHTIAHFNAARVATADLMIGGEKVQEGDGIFALLFAANRDPAMFSNPDNFDISRQDNRHLAFSFGIHQCLGQPLARLELEVVFDTIMKRLPKLRLAMPTEQLRFTEMAQVFSVDELRLTW